MSTVRSVHEAYAEALRYFKGHASINYAIGRLASDLHRCDIDYVVIGAVALAAHGYQRLTEGIDLVLTLEGLKKFRQELSGRGAYGLSGYDLMRSDSHKRFRSWPEEVIISVMTTAEYPGDGKPKPVSMPEPSTAAVEIDGVNFVTLEKLIELKLASGMTAPDRLKDLADVQELIKIKNLGPEFAQRLNPYVQDEFIRLSESVHNSEHQTKEQE